MSGSARYDFTHEIRAEDLPALRVAVVLRHDQDHIDLLLLLSERVLRCGLHAPLCLGNGQPPLAGYTAGCYVPQRGLPAAALPSLKRGGTHLVSSAGALSPSEP